MRCLVTGGAGFIGSSVVRRLLERGHDVAAFDNLATGYSDNLRLFPDAELIQGDIRDEAAVNAAVASRDVVFHLAASVGNKKSIDEPIYDASHNVLGTINVLEALRKHDVGNVVYSSSAGIFGEPQYQPVDEKHPVEPDSPYGATKLAGEKLALAYMKLYGIKAACLRYFNVYGINQRFDAYGNVIPIFAARIARGEDLTIFGDGEQTRDFIDVEDVAAANVAAAENPEARGTFNIGTGSEILLLSTINDVAWGLAERGHEVTVLTGIPNYPNGHFPPGYGLVEQTRQNHRGVSILRVPLFPRGGGQRWRLALNYLSFTLAASVLGPLRARGAFDLIFAFQMSPVTLGLPAILLKKLKRAPMMFWIQDLWPESLSATGAVTSPQLLKSVARLVRFIYRHSDRILVQSRTFAPRVEDMGVEPQRIYYFPNWAEALYQPVELEANAPERDEMPSGFRVMFAGNIGAAQSFKTILDAAHKLRDHRNIHWVVLGDGRMRPWVEKRVEQLDLTEQVHLLGRRPMESMPRYYALADALLVTLNKDPVISLTIPSKTQPYLACRKLIVAALNGEGARTIEEAGAGLVAPAEDAEALARVVNMAYSMSEEERVERGRRGWMYFKEHFEREKLLDRLELWMQEMSRNA